jgi:D-alanine-D-alanine ligase
MKITVLLGGDSPERDVSISSGMGILEALKSRGHEASPLDPAVPSWAPTGHMTIGEAPPSDLPVLPPENALDWLRSPLLGETDAAFVALHGGAGEDGTVQALLESVRVDYTGTGVLGSALSMNKDRSKALFDEAGVQTAEHLLVHAADMDMRSTLVQEVGELFGFPVVVKPNNQGSSVGFGFVREPGELGEAIETAARYSSEVLVERYIAGREITVAILDGEPLPVVEIVPQGGFYDYKRKYTKGTSRYIVPAEIELRVAERFQREALLAYRSICCRDYARVDFRMDESGEPYCLEVNTLPGMTGLSLVPMAAKAAGIDFGELVERICLMACGRGKGPAAR